MQNKHFYNPILAAHEHSSVNEDVINSSDQCACFYCLKVFSKDEIKSEDWISDAKGKTALCPYCVVDAVIGDASGFNLCEEFLEEMHAYWFSTTDY